MLCITLKLKEDVEVLAMASALRGEAGVLRITLKLREDVEVLSITSKAARKGWGAVNPALN